MPGLATFYHLMPPPEPRFPGVPYGADRHCRFPTGFIRRTTGFSLFFFPNDYYGVGQKLSCISGWNFGLLQLRQLRQLQDNCRAIARQLTFIHSQHVGNEMEGD
jgi:hypothetical protein